MKRLGAIVVAAAVGAAGGVATWNWWRAPLEVVSLTPAMASELDRGAEGPTVTPPPAPPWLLTGHDAAATRDELHRALQEGDPHDACLGLLSVGDMTSVPFLIDALKAFPDEEPQGGFICTWSHCVEALEHITGAKPGYSHSAWRRWQRASHP
jgi:hypothetical protein